MVLLLNHLAPLSVLPMFSIHSLDPTLPTTTTNLQPKPNQLQRLRGVDAKQLHQQPQRRKESKRPRKRAQNARSLKSAVMKNPIQNVLNEADGSLVCLTTTTTTSTLFSTPLNVTYPSERYRGPKSRLTSINGLPPSAALNEHQSLSKSSSSR